MSVLEVKADLSVARPDFNQTVMSSLRRSAVPNHFNSRSNFRVSASKA